MKLYRKADGTFVATQAEAGKGFTAEEVPSVGRGELATYLNNLVASELETAPPAMTPEEIKNSNTPEAQTAARELMNPDKPKRPKPDDGAEAIGDWLYHHADSGEVHDVFMCLAARFGHSARKERKNV